MARTRKHRGKFALAAPRVEVVLVPEEQPTSADQVAVAAGTLFDAYLVLHVPDGEPPKTIRLDGGPFDKEGAINIILATYSTLTEKYAEAHLKRGATPSAVYDAKIEEPPRAATGAALFLLGSRGRLRRRSGIVRPMNKLVDRNLG